jgi:hypothetical protein
MKGAIAFFAVFVFCFTIETFFANIIGAHERASNKYLSRDSRFVKSARLAGGDLLGAR